jgi:IS30 family transposase
MIQMGRRSGMSYFDIGAAIGRNKSVLWREVNRNTSRDGIYYASVAQAEAHQARRRPKPLNLPTLSRSEWKIAPGSITLVVAAFRRVSATSSVRM